MTVTSERQQLSYIAAQAADARLNVELETEGMTLNIGPQHPATHGTLRIVARLDGEQVVWAEPVAGYMHRGYEKLTEVRTFPQVTTLINRIDWLGSFANTFHGERRSKRMTRGTLEGIAGLGEVRQKRLVKEMGGVNAVKQASLADLQALAWLPDAVAAAIHERFHPAANGDLVTVVLDIETENEQSFAPMRATERQRGSGQTRPAWPGNAAAGDGE